VLTGVNSIFTGSGRFGSGSHVGKATSELGSTLGAFDLGEFHRGEDQSAMAAGMLPGLYSAFQQPNQTRLAVGQMQDADSLAKRQSEYEFFDRTKNADYNRFKELLGTFSGTQQNAGMAEEPSFLQMLMGGIGTAAGLFL
jgi:hypothetical protein